MFYSYLVVNGHTSIADIKEYEYGGDIFFEITHPPELQYTYRIRPAKSFGIPFVSTFSFYAVVYDHIYFMLLVIHKLFQLISASSLPTSAI